MNDRSVSHELANMFDNDLPPLIGQKFRKTQSKISYLFFCETANIYRWTSKQLI